MTDFQNSIVIPEEVIKDKIYLLRGLRVMLDKDLAALYGVKSIRLREQVKRNSDRFPERFMFQLTEEEVNLMVSQNAIPSRQHLGGSLPYAFTEHGVLMLANILKSSRAIQMSVRIIDVFVKLRELMLSQKDILLKLEKFEKQIVQNSEDIKMIITALRELLNPSQAPRKSIGYKRNEDRENTST
jgi:hypothetical protein